MKIKHALPVALSTPVLCLAGCSLEAPASAPVSASSDGRSRAGGSGWQLVPAHGAAGIRAAGLQVLSEEGTAEHIHAHLDVMSDGQAVTVPPDIGFSFGVNGEPNGISALHTHDSSGIIHIEAPTAGFRYTLGQVLTEWGVVRLKAHDEIVLIHGPAPVTIPSSYSFPAGY